MSTVRTISSASALQIEDGDGIGDGSQGIALIAQGVQQPLAGGEHIRRDGRSARREVELLPRRLGQRALDCHLTQTKQGPWPDRGRDCRRRLRRQSGQVVRQIGGVEGAAVDTDIHLPLVEAKTVQHREKAVFVVPRAPDQREGTDGGFLSQADQQRCIGDGLIERGFARLGNLELVWLGIGCAGNPRGKSECRPNQYRRARPAEHSYWS